jgi:hypothetical protein
MTVAVTVLAVVAVVAVTVLAVALAVTILVVAVTVLTVAVLAVACVPVTLMPVFVSFQVRTLIVPRATACSSPVITSSKYCKLNLTDLAADCDFVVQTCCLTKHGHEQQERLDVSCRVTGLDWDCSVLRHPACIYVSCRVTGLDCDCSVLRHPACIYAYFVGAFSKLRKRDYYVHHVCLSVTWNNLAPT